MKKLLFELVQLQTALCLQNSEAMCMVSDQTGISKNTPDKELSILTYIRKNTVQQVSFLQSYMTKMQFDVDVSPPANIMTFRLGLTHVTFDPDPCDL